MLLWDTSKDYRILVADKSRENYLNLMPTASFRGDWNKKMAIESAKLMNSDFQSLLYSYLEGDDLAGSVNVDNLIENANQIIGYLGGSDWNKNFLENSSKQDKSKTLENIAKIRFFLDSVLGLKERLKLGSINDPVIGIDIRVGEIMSVSKHSGADSLMICNVNLGYRAMTVVTNDLGVRESDVVAVSILPPQTFIDVTSEGMFLGMDGSVLKSVEGEIGNMPKGIPMQSLNETRNLVELYLKK